MLTKGLNLGLNLHLHLYFVYASSEGSGESAQFAQTRLRLHCLTKRSLLVNICWSLYGHFYFKFKWRHRIHIQVQKHRTNHIRNFELIFSISVGVVLKPRGTLHFCSRLASLMGRPDIVCDLRKQNNRLWSSAFAFVLLCITFCPF